MLTPAGLRQVAEYTTAIGPDKALVRGTTLVVDAHAAGLAVHPWTFRAEPQFRPPDDPTLIDEITHYLRLGVDALSTDNPDLVFQSLQELGRVLAGGRFVCTLRLGLKVPPTVMM